MTPAQRTRFYFPAWHRAMRANWRTEKGRLIELDDAPVSELKQSVCDCAVTLALQQHRAPVADDLRHACHVVAIGRAKSSSDLANAEVERVVLLFRLLADPDDLDARINYDRPACAQRRRMEWALAHRYIPGYVTSISRELFGTSNWHTLKDDALHQLVMTLQNRPNAARPVTVATPDSTPPDEAVDCPY